MDYIKLKRNEKSPKLCFMLGAVIQERFFLLKGFVSYCINRWFGFTLYIFRGSGGAPVTSGHGWRPLVDRAAAAGGQRMFSKGLDRRTSWYRKGGMWF